MYSHWHSGTDESSEKWDNEADYSHIAHTWLASFSKASASELDAAIDLLADCWLSTASARWSCKAVAVARASPAKLLRMGRVYSRNWCRTYTHTSVTQALHVRSYSSWLPMKCEQAWMQSVSHYELNGVIHSVVLLGHPTLHSGLVWVGLGICSCWTQQTTKWPKLGSLILLSGWFSAPDSVLPLWKGLAIQ